MLRLAGHEQPFEGHPVPAPFFKVDALRDRAWRNLKRFVPVNWPRKLGRRKHAPMHPFFRRLINAWMWRRVQLDYPHLHTPDFSKLDGAHIAPPFGTETHVLHAPKSTRRVMSRVATNYLLISPSFKFISRRGIEGDGGDLVARAEETRDHLGRVAPAAHHHRRHVLA